MQYLFKVSIVFVFLDSCFKFQLYCVQMVVAMALCLLFSNRDFTISLWQLLSGRIVPSPLRLIFVILFSFVFNTWCAHASFLVIVNLLNEVLLPNYDIKLKVKSSNIIQSWKVVIGDINSWSSWYLFGYAQCYRYDIETWRQFSQI